MLLTPSSGAPVVPIYRWTRKSRPARLAGLCTSIVSEVRAAEPNAFAIYVSNERSGDVSVIDGQTNAVVATIPVGKRPRGIHCSPDGKHVYVVLSGSPRMAPGVDTERAPADKTADALATIDTGSRKLVQRWHIGSDPEQFALSKDGKFAFIANEDDASAVLVDVGSGQSCGKIQLSAELPGRAGGESAQWRRLCHL